MSLNTPAIIAKTREDYNHIARHFSGTRYDIWSELKQFEKYLKLGQKILDWGCGNGRLILILKNKGVEYVGVDQSDEIIKIAREKYAVEIKSGWVKFFCTARRQKNFPSDYFDLVFAIASFHHLPDEESRLVLLKKIYKELKPSGRLMMTNWNLESDWAKIKAKKGWKKIGDNDYLIPWKNAQGKIECERYYHHFTPIELKRLLLQAGFTIKKMEFIHGDGTSADHKRGRNLITIAIKKVPIQ